MRPKDRERVLRHMLVVFRDLGDCPLAGRGRAGGDDEGVPARWALRTMRDFFVCTCNPGEVEWMWGRLVPDLGEFLQRQGEEGVERMRFLRSERCI